jgi:hypothetical protein
MTLKALGAVAIFALCAGTAMAQDLVPYSEAGGWTVAVDPTLGNGCLLTSDYEDGSTVRIGFDRNAGNGYVASFNDGWTDVVAGDVYDVTFFLDAEQYDGKANGIYLNDVPGVWITFDSVEFLADLAARQTMSLMHDGEEVMVIDLAGSAAAIEETIACQEVQG